MTKRDREMKTDKKLLIKQIQELDSIIESSKKAMKENPTHPHAKAIEFLLEQDYEQKRKLIDELEKLKEKKC